MEHKGGDLMFTEITFALFSVLMLAAGFFAGRQYEYNRIMRRLKEVMEEQKNIKPHCGNCWNYNGMYCTKEWNNLDECYLVKDRDSKEPEDVCDDWEFNPMWSPEDDE